MLVTPYCKRIRPGRRTTRVAVPLIAPPCVLSRADPSGLGHVATIYSSVQGPPGVETLTMLYSGRRPGIKDGIGFQQGDNVKLSAPKKLSNFVKGKYPMAQDNEGYILYTTGYPKHKIKRIHSRKSHSGSHHAFMYKSEASSSRQSTHAKLPKKKSPIASNNHNISFKTFDASYVLTNKSGKVVAKYVGAKHKGSKTYVWVPNVLVSNVKGPKTVWVPKNKA
jgi:hypothetical protein